jgi:hypothetical protein
MSIATILIILVLIYLLGGWGGRGYGLGHPEWALAAWFWSSCWSGYSQASCYGRKSL